MSVNSFNQVILKSAEDLSTFHPLETRQLDGLESYSYFLQRTRQGFSSYMEQNPTADERPYQWQYAAVACTRRHNIFGWSMGVGKTLSTLLVIYGLYKEKLDSLRPRSIHIVVPSLLASSRWVEDLERMSEFRERYTLVKSEKDLATATTPIIIYSQDFPKRRCRQFSGSSRNLMARVLKRLRPTLLVIDEVHGLRANTTRTKTLLAIRANSRRCLALTGTPSEGNLKELHNILSFVYGDCWQYQSAQSFSKDFGIQQKISANYLYGKIGHANAPEKYLQKLDPAKMPSYYHLMRRYVHRVRIDEPQVKSCMRLPESEFCLQGVEATAEQKGQYRHYINEHHERLRRIAAGLIERQQAEALQLIQPLVKITNYPELTTEGPTPKIKRMLELVKLAEGKVVIFCAGIASAWLCKVHLAQMLGSEAVVRLYSKDSREEEQQLNEQKRLEVVDRFQYDPNVKAGVFSIHLAGQSIDLTKASDVIYYCLPWSSIKIQQSISRVVRSGNPHNQVKLHYLYTQGMIDEYQVSLAVEKIRCAKLMLDYEIDTEDEASSVDLSPAEALSKLFDS